MQTLLLLTNCVIVSAGLYYTLRMRRNCLAHELLNRNLEQLCRDADLLQQELFQQSLFLRQQIEQISATQQSEMTAEPAKKVWLN